MYIRKLCEITVLANDTQPADNKLAQRGKRANIGAFLP
jgi:hypothetical protein